MTGAYSKLSSYNKNNPTVEGYSTIVVRGRSESQNPANSATIVIYFEFKFITEVSEKLEHETHDPNAQLTGAGTVRVNINQIQMNIPNRLTNEEDG